jgi:hypothetical protein
MINHHKEISPAKDVFPERIDSGLHATPFDNPNAGNFVMGVLIDLTGQRFGRLVVMGINTDTNHNRKSKQKRVRYDCQCDCGNVRVVLGESLKFKGVQSCGCFRKERTAQTFFKDLTGKRVGRLKVMGVHDKRSKTGKILWDCQCDCGNVSVVHGESIQSKRTQSCGCLQKENAARTCRERALPEGVSEKQSVLGAYKNGATRRGYEWGLNNDQFHNLTQQNCHYCGIPPSNIYKYSYKDYTYYYNGIDRINNNIGYIPSNCVACCSVCNVAKHAMSYQDFVTWIHRAASHLTKNKN